MFDIGFSELLLIGLVALIVVGPKDLPGMFRTVGRFMGKARGMAREFQRSMEAAADEAGVKEAADSLKSAADLATKPAATAKNFATQFVKDEVEAPAKADEAATSTSDTSENTTKIPAADETAAKVSKAKT